jgi:hypothetical protein
VIHAEKLSNDSCRFIEWLRDTVLVGVPRLVDVLRDSDYDVRRAAVMSFTELARHGP